jgi:putative hemin transport protein
MNPSESRLIDPLVARERFLAAKGGGARNREAAMQAGLSEGEAIASLIGEQAIRLSVPFPDLVGALGRLGEVMALTRNESTVHEKIGVYGAESHDGGVGLVLGDDIDLRLFYSHWAHGFALTEQGPRGPSRSLQFFDAAGMAVHKVFLKPQSNIAEYFALVESWSAADQSPGIAVVPAPQAAAPASAAPVDAAAFLDAWGALKDTHEFFGLLRKFGVSRTRALQLAEGRFTQPVPAGSCEAMLREAARRATPIMCFVGNPGAIQIHTGSVENIRKMGEWINVIDPRFNLHLRTDLIERAWIVSKPTTDGQVTSLEFFDAQGDTMAMFFGKRKPGQAEASEWRDLLRALPETAP